MSVRSLVNPVLECNDAVVPIVPNSLSFKKGAGDRQTKAQSAGGNAVEIVISEDASTKVSMVKFKLFNTKENFDLLDQWVGNVNGNTIRLSEGEFALAWRGMVVTTEPERMIGVDGEIEVEFQGSPVL